MKTFFLSHLTRLRKVHKWILSVCTIGFIVTPFLSGCNFAHYSRIGSNPVSANPVTVTSTQVATTSTLHAPTTRLDIDGPIIPPREANSLLVTKRLAESSDSQSDESSREADLPLQSAPEKIPILMYHSISDNPANTLCVSPKRFALEMKHLHDANYHPITFHDLENAWLNHGKIPTKPILITFDDGYEDNYVSAYPILKQYHFHATIFIITHAVGKYTGTLTWPQIQQMDKEGLIEFGSHTSDHLDLSRLSPQEQSAQIVQSKQILAQQLGHSIDSFCYPSGRYNATTIDLVKKAGYTFAVTTHPGYAALSQGQWTLDRVRVSGAQSEQSFSELFP